MRGAVPPNLPYVFMVWYLMNRDNFVLPYLLPHTFQSIIHNHGTIRRSVTYVVVKASLLYIIIITCFLQHGYGTNRHLTPAYRSHQ